MTSQLTEGIPTAAAATHVTVVHRPGRRVAEVLPDVFVIEGGRVLASAVGGHLFDPRPDSRGSVLITAGQRRRIERILRSRLVTTSTEGL